MDDDFCNDLYMCDNFAGRPSVTLDLVCYDPNKFLPL